MNDAATSLDRLHDIVAPPPVSWWPLAPGWYFVLAGAVVIVAWLGLRQYRQWRANAYRREALRELKAAKAPPEIAELLRRTALAVSPRQAVASLSGNDWVDWLAKSVPEEMPLPVQLQLAGALYEGNTEDTDIASMRAYAKTWIERHHSPLTSRR